MPVNTVQHLLREVVANPAQAVGVKEFAQVGESCSNARKLLILLQSRISPPFLSSSEMS